MKRKIKADVPKQHNLYMNNLVGDVKANPRNPYRDINGKKKGNQYIPPLKEWSGSGVGQSDLEKAEKIMVRSQMTSIKKNITRRYVSFMDNICAYKKGAT